MGDLTASAVIAPASILILLAHPYLHRSRVNRALIERVEGVAGVTIHNLYEHYPDFYIDVAREQQLLLQSDVVVFQHPFYWYSAPALLKQWQDWVLKPEGAFGGQPHELAGRALLSVVTTGHRAESYQHGGHDHFSMQELLYPFKQIATHCGMRYLEPFLVHGSRHLCDQELNLHAERYAERLIELGKGSVLHHE